MVVLRNNRGNALVTVAVASVLLGAMMLALTQMIQAASQSERGIASNLDLTAIAANVHLILGMPAMCAKSGLLGLDVGPLLGPTPTPVAVVLKLPSSSGTPYLQAGAAIGGTTRMTDSLLLSEAMWISGNDYLGRLELTTKVMGRAATARNPKKDFHLRFKVVDNIITECSAMNPDSPNPTATPVAPGNTCSWYITHKTLGLMVSWDDDDRCSTSAGSFYDHCVCPDGSYLRGVDRCMTREQASLRCYCCS